MIHSNSMIGGRGGTQAEEAREAGVPAALASKLLSTLYMYRIKSSIRILKATETSLRRLSFSERTRYIVILPTTSLTSHSRRFAQSRRSSALRSSPWRQHGGCPRDE